MSTGSSGSSNSGQQQVQQSSSPWSEQQPYLKKLFSGAETDVLNRPLEFFPGSTVVPYSPETEAALSGITNRATQGSPVNLAAQNELTKTIGGGYLNSNPNLSAVIDSAIRPVTEQYQNVTRPAMERSFSAAGRYGSGAMRNTLGQGDTNYLRTIGDIGSNIAFNNYGAERGRQLQAAGMAPTAANTDYQDLAALTGVGSMWENLDQQAKAEEMARYGFAQGEPMQRLANFGSLIGGNYGGTSTGLTNYQGPSGSGFNPFLGVLGGAATLAGVGQAGFGPGFLKGIF